MSVFKVNNKYSAVLNPEAAKLVPELKTLSQEELLYVILVADYEDSPIRTKPREERQQIASQRIFKKPFTDKIETSKIKKALEGYKSLVFDIRREMLDMYKKRYVTLQKELFRNDIDMKGMAENDKMLKFLQDKIESIEMDLKRVERDDIVLKGKITLSFLEKYHRNQLAFKQFKNEESI